MKYLPFEEFEIHTRLSADEVFYRLRAAVDTERKWWIFTNKPFWGEVYRGSFRIWRAAYWSRNFTPITFGIIKREGFGSCILIWMRMPWFSFLFYAAIFCFSWFSFILGHADLIVQRIQTGTWQYESLGEWLLNFVMFFIFLLFIYLISVGTFKADVHKVKEGLLRISETAEENIIDHDRILGITEPQVIQALLLLPLGISIGRMIFNLLQ